MIGVKKKEKDVWQMMIETTAMILHNAK